MVKVAGTAVTPASVHQKAVYVALIGPNMQIRRGNAAQEVGRVVSDTRVSLLMGFRGVR